MKAQLIEYEGRILFEPEHKTKKHELQAEKKRVAMVMFKGDLSEYYAWFLKTKYDVVLNKPVRGSHVTFINDWFYGIDEDAPNEAKEAIWEAGKAKFNHKKIKLTFSLDYHTNGKHWWLIVNHDYRNELLSIRKEIGLDKPTFGFHMTLGSVTYFEEPTEPKKYVDNSKWIQSNYIKSLDEKGIIELKERWNVK